MNRQDTIAAISTPPGRGGIGVVRLSGDKSFDIALSIFKKNDGGLRLEKIESHKAYYGRVFDPQSEIELDEALVLFMKEPKTYTCEDMVEISLHGSPVVLEKVLAILTGSGARLAEPGEFTKRAFLNKRLDLIQAEAVAELINSRSLLESRLATSRVKGELSKKIDFLKNKMIGILSELEARIDFPDERLQVDDDEALKKKFIEIENHIKRLKESYEKNRSISKGITVGIVGSTNVGKSTLFNALLKRSRAITSQEPGTTRDYLEEEIEFGGIIYRIIDTAGINLRTDNKIEKEGIDRTFGIIDIADMILFVIDGTRALNYEEKEFIDTINLSKSLFIVNKIDILNKKYQKELQKYDYLEISALNNIGIGNIEAKLRGLMGGNEGEYLETIAVSNLRQKLILDKAWDSFILAKEGLSDGKSPEFITFDLKKSLDSLIQFKGERGFDINEEVLKSIFSTFCIGK